MNKDSKIKTFTADAEKAVRDVFDKSKDYAVQAMDKNDDGRFDIADAAAIAESGWGYLKKGTQAIVDRSNENARQLELKKLQPVFAESLDDATFLIPKFIRIMERDKKHAESEVCQGSIGFISDQKDLRVVNIFSDSVEAFGLSFYPDHNYEFYYIDPSDRDRYIALDDYFSYLKVARINELQKIAQDLGAKHFRVTYKEEQTSFSEKKVKANAKAMSVSAAAEHESAEKKYSTVEIAAEMEFPGHSPVKPQLKYLQRDSSIQTLISLRMDETAPLLHQKYMLKLSNTSGIKESDALKIDAALKGMKCLGNATVASEAKNESRKYLEYEIDF